MDGRYLEPGFKLFAQEFTNNQREKSRVTHVTLDFIRDWMNSCSAYYSQRGLQIETVINVHILYRYVYIYHLSIYIYIC
jgi:hypothetical protein